MLALQTAGWLYGLEMPPCTPIHVNDPNPRGTSSRPGVAVRRAAVPADEAVCIGGLRVTSPIRTAADLGRQLPLVGAVIAVDMALNRRLVTLDELQRFAAKPGLHRRHRLGRVLALADAGSESPMETTLRLVLNVPGLPRPVSQHILRDEAGVILGRADLYYPQARLVIEYDGDVHRQMLVSDLRRQNRILSAGYKILRFTAADVLRAPASVVDQVRRTLESDTDLAVG